MELITVIKYEKLPTCPERQLYRSSVHQSSVGGYTFETDAGYDLRASEDFIVNPIDMLKPERIDMVTLNNVWVAKTKDYVSLTEPNAKEIEQYIFHSTYAFERVKYPLQLVPTGIKVQADFFGYFDIRPRSSTFKLGLLVANSPGTVDWSYTGEVVISVVSLKGQVPIKRGEAIAQLVPQNQLPSRLIEGKLEERSRGVAGFGSTGQ